MKNFFYTLTRFFAPLFVSLFVSFHSAHAQSTAIHSVLSDEKNTYGVAPTKATNLTYDGEQFALQPVASGLRKKKVFALVHVNFYFAELLAVQPQKIIKTETDILPSLKNAQPIEMKLTFMRDLPNNQIADYFTEAFKANQIIEANYSPAFKQFFEELKNLPKLNKNDVVSFYGLWKKDKTVLVLLFPDQRARPIEGDALFLNQFFSIWFGEPADEKAKALKKELLKAN